MLCVLCMLCLQALHEASLAVLLAGLHTCHALMKAQLADNFLQLPCYHKAHHSKMHRLMCKPQLCAPVSFLDQADWLVSGATVGNIHCCAVEVAPLTCTCCLQPCLNQSNRSTSPKGPDMELCSWQGAHVAKGAWCFLIPKQQAAAAKVESHHAFCRQTSLSTIKSMAKSFWGRSYLGRLSSSSLFWLFFCQGKTANTVLLLVRMQLRLHS